MSLAHALIGLLAVEPRSGYALTKSFEADLGRYAWQAGHTSIYPELTKLAERGLIEVIEEGARGARTYAATEAGRAELRDWLLEPRGKGKVRNEPVLRMFLLSALETDDALLVLRRIAEEAGGGVTYLQKVRADAGDAVPEGRDGFGQLAAEFGLRQYAAVHDWAVWAIEQLERRADAGARAEASGS